MSNAMLLLRAIALIFLIHEGFAQNCTQVGRFPTGSPDCKYYYICAVVNGTLVKTDQNCLGASLFDPAKQMCTFNYTCPATSTAKMSNICNAYDPEKYPGLMMPDPLSKDCSTYYQCMTSDQGYVLVKNSCPTGYILYLLYPYTCLPKSMYPCLSK